MKALNGRPYVVWEAAVEEFDDTSVGLRMVEVEPVERSVEEWGELQRCYFPDAVPLQEGVRFLITVRPNGVMVEDYWITERAKRLERQRPQEDPPGEPS